MKNSAKYFLFTFLFTWVISSCKRDVQYPDEPVLTYKSFTAFGSDSAWLIMDFTDGDGNVGLSQSDTAEPFLYNVFLTYSELEDGEWVDFEFDDIGFNYRIPTLNPSGEETPLTGEIKVTLLPYFNGGATALSDTFKWSGFMVDRALNESNLIESPAFVKP